MEPLERYRRALCGHIDDVGGADDAIARAWAYAITLAQVAAQPEKVRPPSPEALRAFAGDSPAAEVAQRAAALGARFAMVVGDVEENAEWLSAAPAGRHPAFVLEGELARLEFGRAAHSPFDGAALRTLAVESGDAAVVVDLVVAQAWAAEASGELEAALAASRRASRMARTEGLPQQEYLANVTLARCRRLVGHPHLAVRILKALGRIVSTQWLPWIAWELLFAGDSESARALLTKAQGQPLSKVVMAAMETLAASRAGDPERFETASAALWESARKSRRTRADVEALLGAVDVRRGADDVPLQLRPWLFGDDARPPRGLHGLAADGAATEELKSAVVFVAASPPCRARRLLAPGLPLVSNYERLAQSKRRQGRMDTAVAVLALAGEGGIALEEFFERVYEFAYDAEIHQGALRKLLSRVETWLGDHGNIRVEGEKRALALRVPLLIADPRCVPPVDVRVLAVLASEGATSAKEAAKRLRIPLRTAQAALQDLLVDGTAQRVRTGNIVAYQVEDTTFQEPTRH